MYHAAVGDNAVGVSSDIAAIILAGLLGCCVMPVAKYCNDDTDKNSGYRYSDGFGILLYIHDYIGFGLQ